MRRKENKMKAVIYARYSCDNQREESIDGQLRECKAFLQRQGMTFIRSYIDRAFSAKTDNRPAFQQMIKDSSKGGFDAVVVWKLDRFARNRYDSAHYKGILRKNSVKVISAAEQISEGAEGIILESVLEGFAEYYSAELSEKVIRGMTENALKCQYNGGGVAVGYKIDENKHYQSDEFTAPIIQEAFIMYAGGVKAVEIVKFLCDKGVRSGHNKPITKSSLVAILQNRRYIGEYRYRDVIIPGGIPAVVDKELFAEVQKRLERNRRAPSASRSEVKYLLTGRLYCGDCGAIMTGASATGRNKQKYYYYQCVKSKKKENCSSVSIHKDKIEEVVLKTTIKTIFKGNIIEDIADGVYACQQHESTSIPLLQKELEETEKAVGNVMFAIEQGIITQTTKKRMTELEQKKVELEAEIAREKFGGRDLTKQQIVFWLKKMRELDLTSAASKERIINIFINSVYVYQDRYVVNYNCCEESDVIPLYIITDVSFIRINGVPSI